MTEVRCAMHEPVTIARAVELLAEQGIEISPKALRHLIERRKIRARACLVVDARHPLLFDLWELEAAAATRDQRRVAAWNTRRAKSEG